MAHTVASVALGMDSTAEGWIWGGYILWTLVTEERDWAGYLEMGK